MLRQSPFAFPRPSLKEPPQTLYPVPPLPDLSASTRRFVADFEAFITAKVAQITRAKQQFDADVHTMQRIVF